MSRNSSEDLDTQVRETGRFSKNTFSFVARINNEFIVNQVRRLNIDAEGHDPAVLVAKVRISWQSLIRPNLGSPRSKVAARDAERRK